MTDRQVFGVVVRALGVLLAIYAVVDLFTGIGLFVDALVFVLIHMHVTNAPASCGYSPFVYFTVGPLALLTGLLLVRKADSLVRFAYGRES
jgi:hypothetical protein